MAGVCLLLLVLDLTLTWSFSVAQEPSGGSVFVSQQTAHAVLRRMRRYNSGGLEELKKDNLERECREEICVMEEAREWFEDSEKTMEFWIRYVDGDQCASQPCQNAVSCQDGVGSYVCWCLPNFDGKNCEIEVAKQCKVDNGGCSHFCEMKDFRAVCLCAAGYKLADDRVSCEPTETFSCGVVTTTDTRSSLSPRSFHGSNSTDDNYDFNISQFYDDYDLDVLNQTRTRRSLEATEATKVVYWDEDGNVTEVKEAGPGGAFYPTVRPVAAEKNTDTRVVGGDEAIPGEIPWQVALMSYSESLGKDKPFCGGSLISEYWIITAAHCLVNVLKLKTHFFVRLGEHDIMSQEGPERDHQVAEHHIHRSYGKKLSFNHDIALVKLSSPVELSPQRRPICLGPRDFTDTLLRSAPSSLVSGWGRLAARGPEASRLQKLEVPFVDRASCKQRSSSLVTRFMFCAGFLNKHKDACQGDSGGPHATNFQGTWFLTGIVSWGDECAKDGRYGVYTHVARYYDWISQTTGVQIN